MTGKSYHNVLEGYCITLPFLNIFQVNLALAVVFFFLGRCIPNILKPPNQTCLVEGMASFSGDGLEPKGNPRGGTAYRSPIAVNAKWAPWNLKKMDKQQRLGASSTWKCSVAMANQTSKWPWHHHWQEVRRTATQHFCQKIAGLTLHMFVCQLPKKTFFKRNGFTNRDQRCGYEYEATFWNVRPIIYIMFLFR